MRTAPNGDIWFLTRIEFLDDFTVQEEWVKNPDPDPEAASSSEPTEHPATPWQKQPDKKPGSPDKRVKETKRSKTQ
jgi:hypothetical protein